VNTSPVIHVVDDDEAFRTAILRLLTTAGFVARGYGSTGEFLLHPPDGPGCVLLDVQLPGPSGIALQEALRDLSIDLPVIFLTAYADVSSSVRAMKAGAVDFMEKPVSLDALLAAIARALTRDNEDRNRRDRLHELDARFAQLTGRERDIFSRVVSGKANKIIAHELGIAERTVKIYRAQLMVKLGVGSAAELGAVAERLHILDK
jgi:FixJ family two-component response regulator